MYFQIYQNSWCRRTMSMYVTVSNHSYSRWIHNSKRKLIQQRLVRPSRNQIQKSAPVPLVVQPPFSACTDSTTVLYHVFIGVCSASFWRGAWYILDDILFPQSKELSALASLMLGTSGMLAVQGFFERIENHTLQLMNYSKSSRQLQWVSTHSIQRIHSLLRFTAIYSLVLSVVCVWRGTWMSWDILYAKYYNDYTENKTGLASFINTNASNEAIVIEKIHASDPGHALRSGLMSHYSAVLILSCLGIVASVFAPPAAISVIRDNTIFSTKTCIERLLYPKRNLQRMISSNKYPSRRSKFIPCWWHQKRYDQCRKLV
jgi:Fuseless